MASPHAAGVAALLKSTHPKASPAQLQALLKAQANATSCPASYDQEGDGTQDAVRGRHPGQRVPRLRHRQRAARGQATRRPRDFARLRTPHPAHDTTRTNRFC